MPNPKKPAVELLFDRVRHPDAFHRTYSQLFSQLNAVQSNLSSEERFLSTVMLAVTGVLAKEAVSTVTKFCGLSQLSIVGSLSVGTALVMFMINIFVLYFLYKIHEHGASIGFVGVTDLAKEITDNPPEASVGDATVKDMELRIHLAHLTPMFFELLSDTNKREKKLLQFRKIVSVSVLISILSMGFCEYSKLH